MSPVGPRDGAGATAVGGSRGGSDDPRPTGEVAEAKMPHSALAGLMAEPVSRALPVRRSTVLMLVAFLGFGTLMYLYPPTTKTFTTYTTNNPNGLPAGLVPSATTTTTVPPPTTTTTAPSASTTTSTTTTSTTSGVSTTTTTSRPAASTSTTVGSTTTTTRVGTATTSTTTATSTVP